MKASRDLKDPTNEADCYDFLGLMSFFADFIEDFANRAKPLYSLLQGS